MWTYKKPYHPEELTKSYIENRGRLALSRALSIGRVIGFVASGATVGYGLQDWHGLLVKAARFVIHLARSPSSSRRLSGAARTALERLEAMEEKNELEKDPTLSLGLAERLAEEIGEADAFRIHVAELFCKRRAENHGHHDAANKSQPLRRLIADLRINRLLTLNYDTQIEQEFEQLFRTSQWKQNRKRKEDSNAKSDFEKLCSGDPDQTKNLPARVEHSDGTSRSVLSVSMNADNVGELVNFALQPRQFVGQVFHLHGRYDQPTDMVLTDADYRRTYMRSDEQAQTFEEALSALMSGNDILFVGVGMSEVDLLRPLRQFASRDKSPEITKRHVFAMMEHTVKLDMDWLHHRTRDVPGQLEGLVDEYATDHLELIREPKAGREGAAHADYATDDRQAVKFRTEYGVYTIFHGGAELRTIRLATQLLREITGKDNGESPLARKIAPLRCLAALQATCSAIQKLFDACPEGIGDEIPKELFSKSELRFLKETLETAVAELSARRGRPRARVYTIGGSHPGNLSDRLRAFETEARSRALDIALATYSQNKDEWWSDWRKKPLSRNPEFRPSPARGNALDRTHPSVARHRPIYKEVPQAKPFFGTIEELSQRAAKAVTQMQSDLDLIGSQPDAREQAGRVGSDTNGLAYLLKGHTDRDFDTVPPKRIIRASVPRGGGKGALLHILQQCHPIQKHRLYIDRLFDCAPECAPGETASLEDDRYFGSFFLHLSFSMEFASVISALKVFVEHAVCRILAQYPDAVLEGAKTPFQPSEPIRYRDFIVEKLRPGGAFEARLRALIGASQEKRETEASALFHEINTLYWSERPLMTGAGRAHRLEELRGSLSAYTEFVNLLRNKNLRLALVMSGLDKLCDDAGVAYNPMFRALFRMLTGCGAKYPSESDITTPMDLVLISGNKDIPIRYLSDELTRQDLENRLALPGKTSPTDHYSPFSQYRPIGDNRFLHIWPTLPRIALQERFWVTSQGNDLRDVFEASQSKLIERFGKKRRIDKSEIARLCDCGVALHAWVNGAFAVERQRLMSDFQAKLGAATGRVAYRATKKARGQCINDQLRTFVNSMDAAAARGGIASVVQEVLERHKPELRRWGQGLFQSLAAVDYENGAFRNWPSQNLRLETPVPAEEAHTPEANRMVDLVYLILSHLALFPMPVESRVLYGCDEIYRLLEQICTPGPENLGGRSYEELPYVWRDTNRLVRLRLLSQVLDYLRKAGLLIAVQSKPLSMDPGTGRQHSVGGEERTREDIHTRYTIQHQLREFAARQMDLSLPDQGERNFFQVSIYCDQPRDLPAPREDHYELVRQIMERQIDLVRNTTWTLMQFTRRHGLDRLSDSDRKLLTYGLRRRFLKRSDTDETLDAQLPSIHAVPQRIRALYGLLRSGFSIGTISRLTSMEDKELDQPYERFRGWLRGVTNAAIAWDRILDERFFEECEKQPSRKVDATKARATFECIAKTIKKDGYDGPDVPPEMSDDFEGFARPLYRDEIGWLLNERGVVSLVQGQVFDAIPLFQRALEEMHHDDLGGHYDPALHAAVRRVRLNLSLALIDRGHLDRAKLMLSELQLPDDFSSHSGSQISWLAEGYLGLIHHLGGNFELAREKYDATIERAQTREMMRVVSIFAKHRADLFRRLEDFGAARDSIALATSSALNCAQRDILHLAKVSEGNIELTDPKGDLSKVSILTLEALDFAQSMGISRLESEAKCLQAAMMLSQNERVLAGSAAIEASAIANRSGLRLNKLQALKHYGSALRLRGQQALALQIICETRREAERRGYQGLALGLSEEMRQLI